MNCPPALASALESVAAGLADEANHYFLKANFYDHVGGDQARWWLAALWLNESTTRHFELLADELRVDVLLDERRLDYWTRISIPYSEIWDILHQQAAAHPTPNGWKNSLYYDLPSMRMPKLG